MRFTVGVLATLLGLTVTTTVVVAQTNPAADLIVVVDSSGSVLDEVAELQSSINALANAIAGQFVDLQVIAIADWSFCVPPPLAGSDCPDEDRPGFYRHVEYTVGSNEALTAILSSYPQWSGFLRPGARKFFLVLSDSNSNMSAAQFQTSLPPTLNGYVFHGIVAASYVPSIFNPCFLLAQAKGDVYLQLIASTGGTVVDVCDGLNSIAPGLAHIAQAIVAVTGTGTDLNPVAGGNAVMMLAKPTATGATVVLTTNVGGVDLEGVYIGEVALGGEDASLVQQSCMVSASSPTFDATTPGISRLQCTLHALTRTVFIVYEVFERRADISYRGAIRVRRGSDVAVEAEGVIRVRPGRSGPPS